MKLKLSGVGDGFEKERGRGRDRGIDRMEWLSGFFFFFIFRMAADGILWMWSFRHLWEREGGEVVGRRRDGG